MRPKEQAGPSPDHHPDHGGDGLPLRPVLSEETVKVIAILGGDANVSGVVTMTQADASSPVRVRGEIAGLKPGKHGLIVNEFGDLSNGLKPMGPHFNPHGRTQHAAAGTSRSGTPAPPRTRSVGDGVWPVPSLAARWHLAPDLRAAPGPGRCAGPEANVARDHGGAARGLPAVPGCPGRIPVPRLGPGRPRTRRDKVRADTAYGSRTNRTYLRKRKIG
ncbi:superoxide dismutase family protein [Streptomyces sp. NPDC052811]|uniref:superoxide dismutase family protein n=1 Tax=Streptomyces sp. NPDC052811 TaxID=3155731 RepID=UPI00343AEF2D